MLSHRIPRVWRRRSSNLYTYPRTPFTHRPSILLRLLLSVSCYHWSNSFMLKGVGSDGGVVNKAQSSHRHRRCKQRTKIRWTRMNKFQIAEIETRFPIKYFLGLFAGRIFRQNIFLWHDSVLESHSKAFWSSSIELLCFDKPHLSALKWPFGKWNWNTKEGLVLFKQNFQIIASTFCVT